jgi:DeoR family fructose operon transcriptional repressor
MSGTKKDNTTTSQVESMDDASPVYAEERRIMITQMLEQQKKLTVSNLIKHFGVTGATVRADLRYLERAGVLTRTHGGVIGATHTGYEPNINQRKGEHLQERKRIALLAASLIEEGDTILLDAGTTTQELARCIKNMRRLTVVTNDILIAYALEDAKNIETILLGGSIRKGFHCTVNFSNIHISDQLTVDKAFMGTNGFSLAKGATTPDIQQAEAKKQMLAMAARRYFLCGHWKLNKTSLAQFARVDQIQTLITDLMSRPDVRNHAKHGVEVLVAP